MGWRAIEHAGEFFEVLGRSRMVEPTRAEKVAEAQRLRERGLTLREIGERLGAVPSTVSAWLNDPDRSKEIARKESYRGVCEWCGGPTDGSDGPGRAPVVCKACLGWTEDEILAAIRRWADEHGGIPPTATEWHRAGPGHPSSNSVVRRIGWNEALLRAGFALRCDRRPETLQWMEEQLRAGVPVREIADRLGVTADNIYRRTR